MDFKLVRVGGGPQRFSEFLSRNDIELEVQERPLPMQRGKRPLEPYYASARGVEVKEGNLLVGVSGNGVTPEEAIADLASQWAGQTLIINAMSKATRREVQCPNGWLLEEEK